MGTSVRNAVVTSIVESDAQENPAAAAPSEPPADPVVRLRGFGKRYRRTTAVRGVDLEVGRGEIYGLIGPDGAGKSSLLRGIAGVLSFEEGEASVFGVRLNSERAAEDIKGRVGYMPQGLGLNLYPELSVEENVDFFARLRLVPDPELLERKRRLLAMTRLEAFRDRPMKHLSGGMKQKLGLVCTLIHAPDLLILDEPTTGVDPVSRRDFWGILAALLRARGITAIVATAYMDEAARFHRLSLLYAGEVMAQGTPESVQARVPGTVVATRGALPDGALRRLSQRFPLVESMGGSLRLFLEARDEEPALASVRAALGDLEPVSLEATPPELEDVFVALLRHRLGDPVAPQAGPAQGLVAEGPAGAAVEAVELTRDFAAFRAVDRVSFRVQAGEIFGLLGANGAGKTTVIKMLTGLLRPSSGRGQVAGVDLASSQQVKESIGYMSQAFSLYLDLTVMENLHLFAGVYALPRRRAEERVVKVMELAQLHGHERTLAGQLPLGLRQRLALATALLHEPRVLFLDEPTSGVDPLGRRHFWELLLRLSRREGVALLVTTHHMTEAEHCDRLALMHAGRIVAQGSPQALKQEVEQEAGSLWSIATEAPLDAMRCLEEAGFAHVSLFGRSLHLLVKDPTFDAARAREILGRQGFSASAVAQRPLGMEDVFLYHVLGLEREQRQ